METERRGGWGVVAMFYGAVWGPCDLRGNRDRVDGTDGQVGMKEKSG